MDEKIKIENCKLCGANARKLNTPDFNNAYECPECGRYVLAPTFQIHTEERRTILRNFYRGMDKLDEKRNQLIIDEKIFQKIVNREI